MLPLVVVSGSDPAQNTEVFSMYFSEALPQASFSRLKHVKGRKEAWLPMSCVCGCVCPSDQMQGTVTLRNISTSTSGLYQCTSSNAIGKSTCVLNLQVEARKFCRVLLLLLE